MVDAAGAPLTVAIAVSAAAGVVSFASPCVLPLVPGYLAFASGLSGARSSGGRGRGTVLLASVLFVLGFAVFFTVLGGAFGGLGRAVAEHRQLVGALGGILVIAMGLFLLGVLRPAVLEQEARALSRVRRGGLLGAFPLGLVFAAGWTPCIGPTLAAILTLTAADGGASPARGATLAFAYALGLGIPFIVIGGLLDRGTGVLTRLRRHSLRLERAGGAVLVLVGVLLVTGLWDRVLLALQPTVSGFTPAL
ncbi:MAG: cytochrome c biogenesis protein CcdA [Mycobacteriales bacterium]